MTKATMRPIPRQRYSKIGRVSGRSSYTLILVLLIEFTIGMLLSLWLGKCFTIEWFFLTVKQTLSPFGTKTEFNYMPKNRSTGNHMKIPFPKIRNYEEKWLQEKVNVTYRILMKSLVKTSRVKHRNHNINLLLVSITCG